MDQNGLEQVKCSRSDGLAFDVLHKLKKPVYILSTEKNSVVSARASKLKSGVIQSSSNKVLSLLELSIEKSYDMSKLLYIGNDLNDYLVMKECGFTACPSDSHNKIKEVADIVLRSKGGNGVIRELLEGVFDLDFIGILYKE